MIQALFINNKNMQLSNKLKKIKILIKHNNIVYNKKMLKN